MRLLRVPLPAGAIAADAESIILIPMSKRLQVVMSEAEWRAYQRIARQQGVALSEWVRQSLRAASRTETTGDPGRRLAAIRAAARHAFPAPDVEQMLAEIEDGYR
jgi:hypothetical protein